MNITDTNLTPNVLCMRVTIPDTKNIVERMYPLAGSLLSMHNLGHMMNGRDTVAPNMVK